MKFKEGESFKVGLSLTIPDGDSIIALAVEYKNANGISLKRFSTKNSTIALVSELNYSFNFTDQSTLGKSGKGVYQVEIETALLGVKKSNEYQFEIEKATARRLSNELSVIQSGYGAIINVTFQENTPIIQTFVGDFIRLTAAIEAEMARNLAVSAAEEAAISELSAFNSAATSTTQASIATTAANTATTQAGVATTNANTSTIQAGIATTQAGIATTQAGIATTKAGEANTSAINAAISENNAAISESNAAISETNAAASELAADAARDEAVLAVGNILTLVSFTDATITMGIGGNVQIEEGPSIYPSLNITFL